jgi:DNA-binding IclR family transcriptional regulator
MENKDVINDQPSQTLAKGLVILGAFTHEKPHWGIRELARELDINPATVLRLVNTLHNMGYLERLPDTQRYTLGPMIARLGRLYNQQHPLPTLAKKIFESYADAFEYNFYLGQLSNYQVIYLAVLDGRGPIKITVELGGSIMLHTSALGKVLLASQDDDYIHKFIEIHGLIPCTERTIVHPERLWQQIRAIRREGIAVNDGEHFEDVAAIGAPIFDQDGQVIAGVSLAYPRYFSDERRVRIDEVKALVREIAEKITLQSAGMMPARD